MKRLLIFFLIIIGGIGLFELLFWLHGRLQNNMPVDFTGVSTLTVWAAVLTVVFTVFAVIGLLNIDNRIRELTDLKNNVTETYSEMRRQLQDLRSLADKERSKIVKEAQDQIVKIMDKSAMRQNLFDRITQIMGMPDPVARIRNFSEILKTRSELDGLNVSFILCRRGEAYQDLKRDEEAERDFKEAIRRAPDSPEAYIALGYFKVNRKEDYEGSIEYFRKALEVDPTQAAMYSNIANSYAKLGNMALADEYYSKAHDYNVDAAEWYYNKAVTIRNTPGSDEGHEIEEGYLKHALRLNPMFFPAALNLTRIMQERKQWLEAQDHLSSLISQGINPDYFKAVIQRGIVRFNMNLLGVALQDFLWAYNLMPDDLFIVSHIATCYFRSGQISLATQFSRMGQLMAEKQDMHEFDDVFKSISDFFNETKQQLDNESGGSSFSVSADFSL